MRIAVTGANGQVGREVAALVEARGDDLAALDRGSLDVTDERAVGDLVGELRPDVVVNCAAWTAVDACEADPVRARRTNADAVAHLARACSRVQARLVTFSTDYVFDGTKFSAYVETDPVNPLSVYGATKLEGERAALEAEGHATVVRTSWVCGRTGANMVKTVLRLAEQPGELRFVVDQRGHPTFADDLAGMVLRIIDERLDGLYHITNDRAVSWYEFAQEVLTAAGHDAGRVQPIMTADLQPPRPARRPANSVLDNAALRAEGMTVLGDFAEPLHRLVGALLR